MERRLSAADLFEQYRIEGTIDEARDREQWEAMAAQELFNRLGIQPQGDCVFCDVVAGTAPTSVVYEDDATLAFMDLRQPNPGTVLVIPKRHAEMIYDLDEETAARLFQTVVKVARAIRRSVQPPGLSVWQSNGAATGQEVPHVHIHLAPRRHNDGLLRIYSEKPSYPDRDELDCLASTIRSCLTEE